MSLQSCAELIRRADPDRFRAAMAAPPAARAVLFPIFAFNVEVARAPWVTAEPMIAEMRLQWWRDVLEEIAGGGPVRRHEVADVLAPVLDAEGVRLLDTLIAARRRDIEAQPFEDEAAFADYIEATSGNLLWAAARALGATGGEAAVRGPAWAAGLANWFLAIPELEARGTRPLPDGRPEAVRALAETGLSRLSVPPPPPEARPALLATWRARPLLRQVCRDPGRVAAGRLGQSEFRRRIGLMSRAVFGR
ncbi:squalene/phytoene synthase family protein [Psychromarinibacter sp. C21-152]|uniref:Squalene/phytoene synthase family protein n=1 Tax=Psychromarinibacter sediminicola TaxID=3033385 RepID=A0AAE3NW58_9RHOB|nr:squalene/phytoene synthase family protein [Psychromarinibacter sediminicola]MDF0603237.1 squalene/phytoene synthase family protein [Psychromarinibacter sediminicola]